MKVKIPTAYAVKFTEFERGWGSKPWNVEYYDNEEEARKRAIDYNNENNNLNYVPDWYVRADYVGRVH